MNNFNDIEIEKYMPNNLYKPESTWESFEDESFPQYNIPIDLSNDIAVNQMMADQGAPQDEAAEVFSEFSQNYPSDGSSMPQYLSKFSPIK